MLQGAGVSNAVSGVFSEASLAQWRKLLHDQLPAQRGPKAIEFHVKASDVSFSMERSAEVKRWYSHSKALARGRRQQAVPRDCVQIGARGAPDA